MSAVANRYAKALFELSEESKETAALVKHFQDLRAMLKESSELRELFSNAVVKAETRNAVIDGLAKKGAWPKSFINTLKLLSDRGRLAHAAEVGLAFEALQQAASSTVRAEVVSASALSADYLAELKTALESATGQSVVIDHREDASIIGGIITKVGDRVFDGSLRNRLNELSEGLRAN